MSDPIRIADDIWGRGDALLTRLELLSSDFPAAELYATAIDGLVEAANASRAKLIAINGDNTLLSIQSPRLTVKSDLAALGMQNDDESARQTAVTTRKQLPSYGDTNAATVFELAVFFADPQDVSVRTATDELSQAVLSILTRAFTNQELRRLSAVVQAETHQAQWVARLFSGATLQESFSAIASAVAEACGADRVSLFTQRAGCYELVSTSTQNNVDRRAQQVRYLEEFVTENLREQAEFSCDSKDADELNHVGQQYLTSSGAKCVFLRLVPIDENHACANSRDENAVAAVMLETFDSQTINRRPDLNRILDEAVCLAIKRDRVSFGETAFKSLSRWTDRTPVARRLAFLALAIAATFALLIFVPAELEIPVSGKIVAAKTQKLFAPADAVSDEVLVQNGQRVSAGDPLIRLRSAKLDLLSEQIKGDLVVARTELSVAEASRSISSRSSDSANSTSSASRQEVLKARIRGLSAQEKLVADQLGALLIRSPIDGVVDRWDVDHSLAHRVVTHGEYLMDIVAPDEGWEIQLDIPESDSGYVIAAFNEQAPQCRFALNSASAAEFANNLDSLDQATVMGRDGRSFLRGTIDLAHNPSTEAFRVGATVTGSIQCGQRPIGFVWFRSLIQWWRQQSWL